MQRTNSKDDLLRANSKGSMQNILPEDPQSNQEEHNETGEETAKADGAEEATVKTAKRTVESAHRTVTIDSEESPFTRMGYITWRCKECDIWRVPGAPFSLVGDARIFNSTCSFGDTGAMCCNCERMKELLLWKGKTIQLYRRGPNSISPPILLVDKETLAVIWDRDEHGMPAYIEIMKEAKALESSTSRSAWYSEMACNHCRTRVGLKTHEEIARQKFLEAQQRAQEAADNKKKK